MDALNLFDLVPTETSFQLSAVPGKSFTLCRWSLRVRSWASAKYTSEGLKVIFEQQKIEEIADIAFFMLKEKDAFKSKDDFLDAVVTLNDQINIIKALLGAIGIGEPEIKKITDAVESQKKSPIAPTPTPPPPKSPKKIGAKSST